MSPFILFIVINFVLVCLSLILGSRLLRGVTLSISTAFGLTIIFGIINFILSDFHQSITSNLSQWAWTPIYILYDAILLIIFSRFLSGIQFRSVGWAFLLALFMGVFNTLAYYLLNLYVFPYID